MADDLNDPGSSLPVSGGDRGDQATREGPPRRGLSSEFEGYQILDELPRGGQALVFKAVHKATKSKVALKVLPPGLLASAKARHLFEREVDLISALEHPNIVHIRDSGIAGGQYYFAMEYIRGQPLDQYVASAGLPLRPAMELLLKVCDAVAHAHRRGVIHRDLKPSNILVDEHGEPHLLDFGLAKAAGHLGEAVSMMSVTGEIKGTLVYMSPEQASGRSDAVDTRSDVYSLGVVFYQVLTREFPYDVSGATIQTLHHIQFTEPIRPRNILGKFDGDIETILLKALAKDAADRYHSAAEMGDDIRLWLQGLPIHARSGTLYILRKLVRRHAFQTATLVAGLLALIVAGFVCTSYQLCRELWTTKADNRYLTKRLDEELKKNGNVDRQSTFVSALELWHGGQTKEAAVLLGSFFAQSDPECEALRFLSDPRPVSAKVDAFRRRLGPEKDFFAHWIIGEDYLRDGAVKEARESFHQCLRHIAQENNVLYREYAKWLSGYVERTTSTASPEESP